MVETITAAASPALDHIIERPRLIARLAEGGGARVSVLAAPAGYGKTTLARQWSNRQAGPVAWYRTTRASGDVALLAVQLDDLLASVAPELPREPGRVAAIASVNASAKPLGRAILRTFETLSRDILLVVDEWEAAGTDEAEELLSTLVEGLDIRFLITTRTRPDWFTPRLEVYGEGLEIGVDELTMTDEEAAKVLTAVGAVAGRARLMRTAEGWPAVLGLAAMSGDVDFTSSKLLSRTLYEFLAGELLAAVPEETQVALMLLALASVTDIEVARIVVGTSANDLISDAVTHGLLTVTEQKSLSLHPLLRELLLERFTTADIAMREALLFQCRRLVEARLWDEALCVAEAAQDPGFASNAIAAALDDLLAAGRTSSLQRWVAAARTAGAEGGLIDYAESEALLRADELDHAMALARQAAGSLEGDLAARAHVVAGTSAHLTDRPDRTELHAGLAASAAESPLTRESALWVRFLGAISRQAPDLANCLKDFRAVAQNGSKESLMIATAELAVAEIEGGLEEALDDARAVLQLAGKNVDPISHTGVLSTYSAALVMSARYAEGLDSSETLASVAESFGLEFAAPYARLYSASAYIGLRRFAAATRLMSALERDTRDESRDFLRHNLRSQRARLYASVNDLQRALDVLSLDPPRSASKACRGELIGWRALLTSVAGDGPEASTIAEDARRVSRDRGTFALSHIAEALIALQNGEDEAATSHLRTAIDTQLWDPIVIAVRAAPHLGTFIAKQPRWRSWLQQLLAASRDASLAASLGLRIPKAARTSATLSPRESEVHELLAQGLTNDEIAKLLYISLSTTKVHVKHIYEKLGVRSRLEAARALRSDV
jgi:LuxR family transcriptional regulator, maltose regulon positive regulatory protein